MKYLLLLLIPINAFTQITGIGIFKIGLTYEETAGKLADENGIKVYQSSRYDETYGSSPGSQTKAIYEYVNDDVRYFSRNEDGSIITGDLSIIFVDCYRVAGIPIKKIFLKYWKNKLFSIECDADYDLIEALHTKYGDGKVDISEKIIRCQNGLGAIFEKKESKSYEVWRNNTIEAKQYSHLYFNEKCEKVYYSSFTIEDTVIAGQINIKIRKSEKAVKEKEIQAKRTRLKDF